jgi:hypothetical protein
MELTNAYVRVIQGQTKAGVEIRNTVFQLLGHLGRNEFGTFITVEGRGHDIEGVRNGKTRIYLKPTDFEMLDAKTGVKATAQVDETPQRSDDEIAADLKETFEILAEMTTAVASGVVKGLVVSGPAGIGKSQTVLTELEETLGMQAKLLGVTPKFDVICGHITPIMLYTKLYEMADKGSVLVLDDCDVLEDIDALNILKAALDTKKTRKITWGSAGFALEKMEVPTSFEFHGGVIFLTNVKLNQVKSGKLAPHCEAIVSRVHYLDLQIDTMRERLIHIRNVAMNSDMLDEYGFSKRERETLLTWIVSNVDNFSRMDLRTVTKAAGLMKAMPNNWQSRGTKTLFKDGGR